MCRLRQRNYIKTVNSVLWISMRLVGYKYWIVLISDIMSQIFGFKISAFRNWQWYKQYRIKSAVPSLHQCILA